MPEPSISVSRDISVPAGVIFSLLCRPSAHAILDGSGMVRDAINDVILKSVGDVFYMNMFNDVLGNYVIENRVVEFVQERRITWEPVLRSVEKAEFQFRVGRPALHQWGWQLTALDVQRTKVTEFFDCSRSPQWLQAATRDGEEWRSAIESSLANLERLVACS